MLRKIIHIDMDAFYASVEQRDNPEYREIFRRYTDLIEPLSLDEAYFDVTEDLQSVGSRQERSFTCSTAIPKHS